MTDTPDITLTDALVARVHDLRDQQKRPDMMLRVAVLGGGCSGFQYQFSFADAPQADDQVFKKDDVSVVIDQTSLDLLRGSIIDFADELIGASFQIKNPNAKSSCGCGTSFST